MESNLRESEVPRLGLSCMPWLWPVRSASNSWVTASLLRVLRLWPQNGASYLTLYCLADLYSLLLLYSFMYLFRTLCILHICVKFCMFRYFCFESVSMMAGAVVLCCKAFPNSHLKLIRKFQKSGEIHT